MNTMCAAILDIISPKYDVRILPINYVDWFYLWITEICKIIKSWDIIYWHDLILIPACNPSMDKYSHAW